MKTYKVVPYVANVTTKQTSQDVALSVQDLINIHADAGWDFGSIEKFETNLIPAGCLSFGQRP